MMHLTIMLALFLLADAFSVNMTAGNDVPTLEWVKEENNAYMFEGTKTIYFGCVTSATKSGGTYCNDDSFSDPCYNVGKHCWYFDGDNLVKCADENGSCFFSGTKTIYFGAMAWADQTNGCDCTTAVFGDPADGVSKDCYIRSDQAGKVKVANDTALK